MFYDLPKPQPTPDFSGLSGATYGDDFESRAEYTERPANDPIPEVIHPFKVSATSEGLSSVYEISKGSIIDGTNGDPIDLGDIIEDESPASSGHVCVEAAVNEDLSITGWTKAIKGGTEAAKEVEFTTEAPVRQTKIRLHLGKITIDGDTTTVAQACFQSQRITHGVINGVPCKVFESAPTHPSSL